LFWLYEPERHRCTEQFEHPTCVGVGVASNSNSLIVSVVTAIVLRVRVAR
jgi:hypothetical protein